VPRVAHVVHLPPGHAPGEALAHMGRALHVVPGDTLVRVSPVVFAAVRIGVRVGMRMCVPVSVPVPIPLTLPVGLGMSMCMCICVPVPMRVCVRVRVHVRMPVCVPVRVTMTTGSGHVMAHGRLRHVLQLGHPRVGCLVMEPLDPGEPWGPRPRPIAVVLGRTGAVLALEEVAPVCPVRLGLGQVVRLE